MTQSSMCSREEIMNFLLDRYKCDFQTVSDMSEHDHEAAKEFLDKMVKLLTMTDITVRDIVEKMLDKVCEFFGADTAYAISTGRVSGMYVNSEYYKDPEKTKYLPQVSEFSLMLINRVRNEMRGDLVCFLPDVNKIKKENPEVYGRLKVFSTESILMIPIFRKKDLLGIFVINNMTRRYGDLGAVRLVMELLMGLKAEQDSFEYKLNLKQVQREAEISSQYSEKIFKTDKTLKFTSLLAQNLSKHFAKSIVIKITSDTYYALSDANYVYNGAHIHSGAEEYVKKELLDSAIENYRDDLKAFCDFSTLSVRLKNKEEISTEYINYESNWCRASFIKVDEDNNSAIEHVLFVETFIENEKTKEGSRKRFVRSLSEPYDAVYLLDLDKDTMEPLKSFSDGCRCELIDAGITMKLKVWRSEYLYIDASDKIVDFFDLVNIEKALRDNEKISLEFATTKNGWVNSEFIAYARNTNGEVRQILWTTKNIARRRNEKILENIISGAWVSLGYISIPHNIYDMSVGTPMLYKYLSKSGNVGSALSVLDLFVSDEYKGKMKEFVDFSTLTDRILGNKEISAEYLNKDGEWRLASMSPLTYDESGNITEFTFGIKDIDALKKHELEREKELEGALEEAKRASIEKNNFFSNLSHDIRTPMNAIIGMTRIARDNIKDIGRVRECLDKIDKSSSHLLALINDSLDLSRIEKGKEQIQYESVNLNELQNNFMSIMQGYMVDRKLEFVTETEPLIAEYVYTDELHLRQIILNILSNAVKYTPDGKRIIYRMENKVSDDGQNLHIRYIVADSGIGMSKEFIRHIFEPFSRADRDGDNPRYKGTGLGMAIVKNFVDMLHGKIDIQSELEMGTVVTVEFDFKIDLNPHEREENTDAEEEVAETDLHGTRIMLVEDNEINREVAIDILKDLNLNITEAVNGQDAVDKFRESGIGEYKCILMDIMMPVLDGYEATKTIRAMDREDAKTVPIVAMTANAFMEDVKVAKNAGMNDHIAKPVTPEIVKRTLKKYLNQGVKA